MVSPFYLLNLQPMLSLLQQPYPPFTPGWRSVRVCSIAGICVFLILFLFKPFGLQRETTQALAFIAAVYGLVTFGISALASGTLPLLLPAWFKEEQWTVGREIIFFCGLLIIITLANLITTWFLWRSSVNGRSILKALWVTVSVGIFPILATTFLKQRLLLQKYAMQAGALDEQMHPVQAVETAIQLELTGDNQHEKITLDPARLLFIGAADNYCKITYLGETELAHIMFRSTLKKMEGQLQAYPFFYRCHRAYIVNMNKVVHISGNAQGFKLHLAGLDDTIPVSRSLNEEIGEKLSKR
jgi:LytTr DNA-binding domain